MNKSYGFTLDTNDFIQSDGTRFFEIEVDKEAVDRFIKDLELFEKRRAEEEE